MRIAAADLVRVLVLTIAAALLVVYATADTTDPSPLVADAGPDRTVGEGVATSFSGSASGGTGPYTFAWQFGDGTTGMGATPTHVYADNGAFVATLTVTDAAGSVATDTVTVTVSNTDPTASAGGPYAGPPGSPIPFSGSATDPSPIDAAAGLLWLWDFGDETTGVGSAPTHTYAAAGVYTVRLTVIDKDGGSGSATTTATVGGGPTGPVRAFPGAEGFGANAVGGRGGRVIEVTNLNDSGPGSLRAAVRASGPRIVVFRVGGTIELLTTLFIRNPFITIAGQTAPGGGIALKNHASNTKSLVAIEAGHVIIRYLRLRPGPSADLSSDVDALLIRRGSNIIIDHCSTGWAVDENVNTWYSPSNITIQWSIIAEALEHSLHTQGPHSMGMHLGSDDSHSISVHHNLFAHNNKRNPSVKTHGTVDFVNNLVYNWGEDIGVVDDKFGRVPLNFVGNYYQRGPSSASDHELDVYERGTNGFSLFVQGNIGPNRPTGTEPDSAVVSPSGHKHLVSTRNPAPLVTTTSAAEAFWMVLANAGATLPQRDAVDARIVNDVRNGTGRIIDHPDEVGGWPVLAAGTPPVDTDHDGMPDDWELAWGLDPASDDSAGDRDGDGYTNVEEYLHSLTSGNLLANPGFEEDADNDGGPDGWTPSTAFSRSGEVVRSGLFAGRHFTGSDGQYTIRQHVDVSPGTAYSFSGCANIPPGADVFDFRFHLRWLDPSGGVVAQKTLKGYTAPTGGVWDCVLAAGLVAPTGAIRAEVRMVAKSIGLAIYVDDLVFEAE